ncbi:O-antigen ligase family protein [bacterium]|nr:O-antigen ligase family protein [bacterium]
MTQIKERLIEYSLLFLLAITLFVPSTIDVFTNSLVNLLVAVIFFLWLTIRFPRYTVRINLPLLLFLLYSLFSLFKTCNFAFTLMQIYMFISLYLLLIMVINVFDNKDSIRRFTVFFLVIGGLKMLQVILIKLLPNTAYQLPLFLPFSMANDNHLAGYLTIVISIAGGIFFFKRKIKKSIKICLFLYLITGFILIFSANSRSGLIALLFSFLILIYIKNKKFLITGLVVVLMTLIYCFFFLKIGGGFKRGDIHSYERLIIWEDTLNLWSDYPVFGSGVGSFRDYYPQYKRMEGTSTAQYAHNEYLNLLVEMGIVGFVLFGWIIVRLFREAIPRRFLYPGFFAAFCSVLIQAGVEFNLHNIAITFPCCFLIGIILPKEKNGMEQISYLTKIPIYLGVVFLVFLFSLPHLGAQFHRKGQNFLKNGRLIQAKTNIFRSVFFNPVYSEYHMLLGEIYEKEGYSFKALDELKIAVELEPRNVWYKKKLAQKYLQWKDLDKAIEEYEKIVRLAPNVFSFRDELRKLYRWKLNIQY